MHHASHVQRLECAYIGRGHSNNSPRVLEPKLDPLLPLYPLHNLMRLHDLDRVRVGPRANSDPMPPDDHSAAGAGSDGLVDR